MANEFITDSKSQETIDLAQQILAILHGIRFGSLEIVVHDGRVVQIDKHEKFRIKSQSPA